VLRDGLRADEPHGQYFKEQVRIELVQRFGWQRVYQGGLRVFSTVNMPLQIAAESAVDETLQSLDARRAKLAAIVRRPVERQALLAPRRSREGIGRLKFETGAEEPRAGRREKPFPTCRLHRARRRGSSYRPASFPG